MSVATFTRAFGVLAACALLAGCPWDDDDDPAAPLQITTQPADATVNAGATATFSVVVDGAAANYQWRRNGAAVGGATGASYTTPATTAADDGATYSVVVTRGSETLTSRDARLTVRVPPTIATQPADASALAGATATFSVVATGTTPLSYQWRRGGTDIAGATGASYTTPAVSPADDGATYVVVVTNAAGSVTSAAATLRVLAPPTIATQPANQAVVAPASATFTVVASGPGPLTYQWRRGGTDVAGATGASYTTPATTGADDGASYSVVVSNAAGAVTSASAALTVNVAPSFATQPASQSVTAPATATFTVAVAGRPTPTLRWQVSTDGANWTDVAGATGTSYTTPATSAGDDGKRFRAVATSAAGTATSNAATLTIAASGRAWGTAQELRPATAGLGVADAFTAAGGGAGEFVTAWVDFDTNTFRSELRASRYTPGSGWSAPVTIVSTDDTGVTQIGRPVVAMDGAGRATLVFLRRSAGSSRDQPYATQSTTASNWSTPVALQPDVTVSCAEPAVAADATGRVTVVWLQGTPGGSTFEPFTLVARQKVGSAAWSGEADLVGAGLVARSSGVRPKIAARNGRVLVAWTPGDTVGQFVAANFYAPTDGWQPTASAVTTSSAAGANSAWDVALDAAGTGVIAVRRQVFGSATSLWLARRAAGSTAWQVEPVDAPAGGIDEPTVALSPDGTVTMAWRRNSTFGTALGAFAAQRSPGGPWSTPVAMTDTGSPGSLKLQADASGDVLLVWSANARVVGARLPAGGAWSATQVVESPPYAGSRLFDGESFAIAPDGTAAVVWIEGNAVPWANVYR